MTTTRATRTVALTFDGETRTLTISSYNNFAGDSTYTDGEPFVATIGRGAARYPADAPLWKVSSLTRKPSGRDLVVVDSEGEEWLVQTTTTVRNRSARLTGWAETATNQTNQVRK